MSVMLKSAIIHILDPRSGAPVLSNHMLLLDQGISDYISELIDNVFSSDDTKDCTFRAESNVWEQCQTVSWDPIVISQSIAKEMFTIMSRNDEIPSADIVSGIAQINRNEYFYLLKLNYRCAYTHFVDSTEHILKVNIISNQSLLPSATARATEAFFIDVNTPHARICEKKYAIDGAKDFYISTRILACTENKSPRQKATKLIQIAEKVGSLYYTESDEIDTHISTTIFNELKMSNTLPVKKLGQEFFPHNPAAQQEFFERLTSAEIDKDDTLTLSEKFQKKYEKQAIKTSSGVEIKIPTLLYSNTDEIEFINNPNGTVSLLIKNIKL